MTGVLPITLADATKIVQVLLHSGKEYVCVMKLHGDAKEEHVKKVLEEFQDQIYQRPPLRSSVKRQLRTRHIYYIDYLERNNRNVLFKVGCESGTYIRKLCFDIGEVIGVGAHMQELRRTRAGPFVENSDSEVNLHEVAYWFSEWEEKKDDKILRKIIQPMEAGLALIPKIVVRDSAVDALCHGANLTAPGILSVETGIRKGSMAAIVTIKGEAVALVKTVASTEDILSSKRGTMATLQRVLMARGTYPKIWKSDSSK